jgi:hypothetical protein
MNDIQNISLVYKDDSHVGCDMVSGTLSGVPTAIIFYPYMFET